MSISYVGGNSNTGTGATISVDLTALTGGSDSSPSTGDLVVVCWGHADTTDRTMSMNSSGYTVHQDRYQTETWDPNLGVASKFMGASVDTTCIVNRTSNAAYGGAAVVHVWRGVDVNNFFDVAMPTPASGTNSQLVNPPSITPVTSGAVILAMGIGSQATTGAAFTAPANCNTYPVSVKADGTTADVGVFISAKTDWTSGAFDPNAVTGGTGGTSAGWIGATMALRPTLPYTITPGAATVSLAGAVPDRTVTTNIRLYYVVYSSSLAAPSATQIRAGQDVNGSAATASGSEIARLTTGEEVFAEAATGLTQGTAYKASFVWSDQSNNSNVVTTATFYTNSLVLPGAGTVSLAGAVPDWTIAAAPIEVAPGAATVSLSGQVPDVSIQSNALSVMPDAATLSLAGYAPLLTLTGFQWRTPDAGALSLSGQVPQITLGDSQARTPDAGLVSIAGQTPIVGQTYSINPGAGAVALSGAVPSVTNGQSVVVTPGAATVSLAGAVPTGTYATTLYYVLYADGIAAPSAAQIRAGQDSTGSAALASGVEAARMTSGTQAFSAPATGLTRGPLYRISIVAAYGADNSNVVTTVAFSTVTEASPGAATVLLTGSTPTILLSATIRPDAGTVALSATAPTISLSSNAAISPAATTVSLAGSAPTVVASSHRTVSPGSATVFLTAYEPTMSVAAVPSAATVQITGSTPTVSVTDSSIASPGAATVALTGALPHQTYTLPSPAAAVLVLDGSPPGLMIDTTIEPAAGTVFLSGVEPTLASSLLIAPDAGQVSITGEAPTMLAGENPTIAPPAATVALSGAEPIVVRTESATIVPSAGLVTLAGATPIAGQSYIVAPDAGVIVLVGGDMVLGEDQFVRPQAGLIEVEGRAPSVDRTLSVQPDPGAIQILCQVPITVVSDHLFVEPDAATVLLGASDPIVLRADDRWITPGALTVEIVGAAPEARLLNAIRIEPDAASIAISGLVPRVRQTHYGRHGKRASGDAGSQHHHNAGRPHPSGLDSRVNAARSNRQPTGQPNMRVRR